MKKKIVTFVILPLLIVAALFYYLIFTDSGKRLSYDILSFVATQKIGLHTKVTRLDLRNYPYMQAKLLIDKKYHINIDGYYKEKKFDLHYTIQSKYIQSDAAKLKNDLFIEGSIKGPRKALKIDGNGTALDGTIRYSGTKYRHSFEDVDIKLEDINSTKLFQLLGEDAIFQGAAQGSLHFEILSHEKRKGLLHYSVKDRDYHGLEVDVNATIRIEDHMHHFEIEAKTKRAKLTIYEGTYNQKAKEASALFRLHSQKLSDLKSLLKFNYNGPLHVTGDIGYTDKNLSITGSTQSLGGELEFVLADKQVDFTLHQIPLSTLLAKLDIEPPFESNLTGSGAYAIKSKELTLNATLSPLHFTQSKALNSLSKSLDINLSSINFNDNRLHITTQDGKLLNTLILTNKTHHIILKKSHFNPKDHLFSTTADILLGTYTLKGPLKLKVENYTGKHDIYVDFDGSVQKHYALKLKGMLNQQWVNMHYQLSSARLPSHICTIVDDVNLSGELHGSWKRLHITGKGKALDGNLSYKALLREKHLEDVELEAQSIHALKLSTLLGYPELPYGKGDLKASFSYISPHIQQGDIYYWLHDATLYNLPFDIDTRVKVNSAKQTFTANVSLGNTKLTLTKGEHNNHTGVTSAFYRLNVAELSELEPLLGYAYRGPFYAVGTLTHDNNYTIHGLSKSFGGYTEYRYDEKTLHIDLENTSLKRILRLFPYPQVLDATTNGTIVYDFLQERLRIKTHFKDARFSYHKSMDTLYQKADINLLKERFSKGLLDVNYQHKTILGNIILEGDTNHLSLTNAQIDTKLKTINGYFDVKMQGKEFSGKLYGPLDNPKVNLNFQKLIRHEMDRQLDSIMGEGNRKLMENMPMGNAAKDMASGMGGAFMGIFF